MSNFLSDVGSNLGSVTDKGQILNAGVDKNRVAFLKGLTSTSSGQKEDPTYTGFRIMFDFGLGGLTDPETFLPISPLLCDMKEQAGNMGNPAGNIDMFTFSKNFLRNDVQFPNYTSDLMYMSAQRFLKERRSKSEDPTIGPSPGAAGSLERNQDGTPIRKDNDFITQDVNGHRCDALIAFKQFLNNINQKSPWYFQSIDGLDSVLKVNIPRQIGGNTGSYKAQRSGILTFNCMDSIDLRVNAMAELYRKATYDYEYHREMLPANLRKFRMWIIVTEIRQMVLQQNLANVLNPFNISGVGNAVSSLTNIAQSAGILSDKSNDPSAGGSAGNTSNKDVNALMNKLEPYILMYQLDLCEFNFDESYAFTSLNNAEKKDPVTSKFKVHVGSAKEYKLQYNILKDFINNGSPFNGILIQDGWNLGGSVIGTQGDVTSNSKNLFTKLANNFITNSVAGVVQQQISPLVTGAMLGNAYGFNLSQAVSSLNSAQDLVSGIQNAKSPLGDFRPQSQGLGGPGQREYPTVNENLYTAKPGSTTGSLGNVYPADPASPPLGIIDQYPNNPGKDLGLPDRQYPTNNSDEYQRVPGFDLGVPNRIYPQSKGDVYTDNPGKDLGLPDRQYPANNSDEYQGVPGFDLGVPNRIYTQAAGDVYPDNPGKDLGLPDRQYPVITRDEYPDVPGSDLGAPVRLYKIINQDVYSGSPGPDLGLPERKYPIIKEKDY